MWTLKERQSAMNKNKCLFCASPSRSTVQSREKHSPPPRSGDGGRLKTSLTRRQSSTSRCRSPFFLTKNGDTVSSQALVTWMFWNASESILYLLWSCSLIPSHVEKMWSHIFRFLEPMLHKIRYIDKKNRFLRIQLCRFWPSMIIWNSIFIF